MRSLKILPSFFFFLILSCGPPLMAAEGEELQQIPQLTVRGEAILKVPANQFRLQVGVVTEAKTALQALEENRVVMEKVIRALQKTGLSEEEYKTSRFDVRPNWSPRPRNAQPDWRPRITGYTVRNALNIRTQKIDLAGPIIGAAGETGANKIDSIIFDLADPRKYRAEAIGKATSNALEDARTLAAAASVRLVQVLSLQLDNASATPVTIRPDTYSPRMMAAMEEAGPPIVAGEVTVQAGVQLVYQIEKAVGEAP